MNYGLCACGCGEKIKTKDFHKYRNVKYISGHNVRVVNPLSLLDKTKDGRKGQTGFLAPKTISGIKYDAIKAGYEWVLDDVFAFKLITSSCAYCGKESGWPNGRNGIDRMDSSIDYYPDNCIACCKICNRAKSNMSSVEFKAWSKKLYLNLLEKDMENV